MNALRRSSLLFLCLGLLGFIWARGGTAEAATEKQIRYEQLAFAMGGHEVGTTTARDFKTKGGYRLERESDLSLKRGPVTVEMKTKSVSHVTRDLRPIRFRFEKRDASGLFVVEGKVKDGKLHLTSTGGGSEVKDVVPLPKDATFASAAEVWVRDNLRDGASLERPVILEEMGAIKPLKVRVKKSGDDYEITVNIAGLAVEETVDEHGRTKVSRTPALGAVAYPVGAPPPEGVRAGTVDMLARSTWPAPRLPASVKRVRYRVWTPDAAHFHLPEDRRQKVVARNGRHLDIEVTDAPSTSGPLDAAARKTLTKATPYEAVSDPRLVEVAKAQTRGAKTTRETVERLVRYVYGHVDEKTLDRGYAPATATLQSKTGDCTEHSVLLSALLRSLGIPTRLVDGVVVDGGRAGYHEWVEVQIDGEGFVPADPTFGQFPASPARLKLAQGTSAPEGLLDLGIAAGRILRPGVKIEVISSSP